jgi:hypothetical protein
LRKSLILRPDDENIFKEGAARKRYKKTTNGGGGKT